MNKWIQKVDAPRLEELKSENRSSINIGDTVRVGVQIREGDRTRVQNYQGTVIRQHNNGVNSTITVRRIFQGSQTIYTSFCSEACPTLAYNVIFFVSVSNGIRTLT